jgi:hypothetical protein
MNCSYPVRWRATLACALVGAVLCLVFLASNTTLAHANTTSFAVHIHIEGKDLPRGTTVQFYDVGGNCDKDKTFPKLTLDPGARHHIHLFTTKSDGSCFFENADAQERLAFVSPNGERAWANINVRFDDQGSCYAVIDITCKQLEPNHSNPGFYFGPFNESANPRGFTACSYADHGDHTCNTPGKSTVAYGVDKHYVYKSGVTGAIACDQKTFFGIDPSPGNYKVCFTQPSGPDGFVYCDKFSEYCNVKADTRAAYGLNGDWSYKNFSARFLCLDPPFGSVPPSYRSKCYIEGPGNGAELCAQENQTCYVAAKSTVIYGADGHFSRKYGVTGRVVCGADAFGDPIPDVLKSCFAKRE